MKDENDFDFMNKKAQAFMEFLMLYGWAIFASIVVISVLIIFFDWGNPSTISSTENYSRTFCKDLNLEYGNYEGKGINNREVSDIKRIVCLEELPEKKGIYFEASFTGNFSEAKQNGN